MTKRQTYLDGEDILVITAGFWDAAKRIRHKMPIQWARAGCRVLWIEQCPFPPQDWFLPGQLKRSLTGDLREVEPRLFVGAMPPALPSMYRSGFYAEALKTAQRPFYVKRLQSYIDALDFKPKLVVLFQQAARRDIFSLFPDAVRVYYHHDVYGFGHATPAQQDTLVACCKTADMVWCVAKEHARELSLYNRNTHFLPHAVDADWYAQHRERIPLEYGHIPAPRLVYTGVFQEKIDLPLLIETARAQPKWQLVIVGPVEPKNLDTGLIEILRGLPNVHFMGERDTDALPGYMEGASVLMLPYLPTENMKSAGLSLKFFEYLISGKPILTAPYTKMQVPNNLYYMADGPSAWAAALDRLENGDDVFSRKRRIEAARENSYNARLAAQREILAAFSAVKTGD